MVSRRFAHTAGCILFGLYLLEVLNLTLFEFQFLLILKMFVPTLQLNGLDAAHAVNVIPLVTLTVADLKTSGLNVLLFVPLGLGLALLFRIGFGRVLAIAALFSLTIEAVQYATGQWAHVTFRVADINDLIFNTLGACWGYGLFLIVRSIKKEDQKDR